MNLDIYIYISEILTREALVVLARALSSVLNNARAESSASWTRIVYLVTNGALPSDPHQATLIRSKLIHTNTSLRLLVYGSNPMAQLHLPNMAFWHHMIEDVQGSAMEPLSKACSDALAPTLHMSTSAPTRTVLSFGNVHDFEKASLDIPVHILKATALQRPQAPRRVMKGEDDMHSKRHVESRRLLYRADDLHKVHKAGHAIVPPTAHTEMDNVTPLPEECAAFIQRAYKLGASLVPLENAPPALPTEAGLEILHFVSASTYRREYHMGETYYVIAHPSSKRAQVALSSLVQAAAVKGVYALCRLVTRPNADPKLCILAPLIESEYDAFYLVHVPFRDDVKRVAFPPLDRVMTSTGASIFEHPTIPTNEQQSTMDAFVDQMDLMDMDDEGDPEGWYTPTLSYHPAIHGLKNAIKWRYLYPQAPLLPLHASLQRFLHVPRRVEERARPARDACAAAFGVHVPPSLVPTAKRNAGRTNDADIHTDANSDTITLNLNQSDSKAVPNTAPESGKLTHSDSDTDTDTGSPQAHDIDQDPLNNLREQVTLPSNTPSIRVGDAGHLRLNHLKPDFEALLATAAVSETCHAMAQALLALVSEKKDLSVLMPALLSFRQHAAELDEALTWNSYVYEPG